MSRRLLSTALLLAASVAAARAPTRSDRFWANYEGFELEAYVAMKELGTTLSALEAEGSITRRGDESGSWLKEKVGDTLVDWATDINPAVKPIKSMSDFAQSKTRAWLDWSFRSKVNSVFVEYKRGLKETGDVKKALERATALIDDLLVINMNAKDQQMLQVLKQHRGVVFAQLIKTDAELHPGDYPADLSAALGGKKTTPGGDLPADVRALGDKARQALLDCLCDCGSSANMAKYWHPEADGSSPSCATPSQGPCINKGFGCFRTAPASSGRCAESCAKSAGLSGVPRLVR